MRSEEVDWRSDKSGRNADVGDGDQEGGGYGSNVGKEGVIRGEIWRGQ